MSGRRGRIAAAVGLLAVALVAVVVSLRGEEPGTRSTGTAVVFSVFENLPPAGACPGLYAVDAETRRITYLGTWDASRRDTAVYPAFTADGSLSYGHWVETTADVPFVDVYAGTRKAARGLAFTGWAWSPRRGEVAYGRVEGRRLDLVLASLEGSQRVLARSAGLGIAWLPDGSGLVYGRREGSTYAISFVGRDGRGRRDVVRNVFLPAVPVVSPDGARVAFVRNGSSEPAVTRLELWVSPLRGGPAKRVLGPAPHEGLKPALWLTKRDLLVQHGGESDPNFDVGDRVTLVDVETGRERPFLAHAYVLSRSPDGRRVLFVRRHGRGEFYYSIRTVTTGGRDEHVLAVTDEEDMNIGSLPVWKPAGTKLSYVGDPLPGSESLEDCARQLTEARDRTG